MAATLTRCRTSSPGQQLVEPRPAPSGVHLIKDIHRGPVASYAADEVGHLMSRRSRPSRKAHNGVNGPDRSTPLAKAIGPCPGTSCRLCRLLGLLGEGIPVRGLWTDDSWSLESERPGLAAGPLQINTPGVAGADQRAQRIG